MIEETVPMKAPRNLLVVFWLQLTGALLCMAWVGGLVLMISGVLGRFGRVDAAGVALLHSVLLFVAGVLWTGSTYIEDVPARKKSVWKRGMVLQLTALIQIIVIFIVWRLTSPVGFF